MFAFPFSGFLRAETFKELFESFMADWVCNPGNKNENEREGGRSSGREIEREREMEKEALCGIRRLV